MARIRRDGSADQRRRVIGRWPDEVTIRPSHALSNTERFWLEYAARPAANRARSVSSRVRLPYPGVRKHRQPVVRALANKCMALFGDAKSALWRHRRKIAVAVAAGTAVAAAALLAPHVRTMRTNVDAYVNMPPPDLVSMYTKQNGKAVPHWLFRESIYTALGLPQPWLRRLTPTPGEVDRAFRAMGRWQPDKWKSNGLTRAEAEQIWAVVSEANSRFETHFNFPECSHARIFGSDWLRGELDGVYSLDASMAVSMNQSAFDGLPALRRCPLSTAFLRALTAPFKTPQAHEEQWLADGLRGLGECALAAQGATAQTAFWKGLVRHFGRFAWCRTLGRWVYVA